MHENITTLEKLMECTYSKSLVHKNSLVLKNVGQGKLPGLVVNIEDSQSEPKSLDVSSIPGFA